MEYNKYPAEVWRIPLGYPVEPEVSGKLFRIISKDGESGTISDYQTVLNEYLVASELGRDEYFWRSRGFA